MILSFQPQFVPKILAGTKIHTIRQDRGQRWYPGRIIHMATGTRSKAYKQFNKEKCISVQSIDIFPFECVFIGEKMLSDIELRELALNDGFTNTDEFYQWFNQYFTGKIIHWTNKLY